jgi:hypothetical protein
MDLDKNGDLTGFEWDVRRGDSGRIQNLKAFVVDRFNMRME